MNEKLHGLYYEKTAFRRIDEDFNGFAPIG